MLHHRLDRSSVKFNDLDHVVLRAIRSTEGPHYFIALAVSGGADSVCLLDIVARLQPVLKVPVYVLHVHHGRGKNATLNRYRLETQKFVKQLSRSRGIPFRTNLPKREMSRESEGALRELRLQKFSLWMAGFSRRHKGPGLLLLAQHLDDLLETRLLRLIRGTGAQGFKAMQLQTGTVCRPFLSLPKARLLQHLETHSLSFVEDPSNRTSEPLRNWIRNEWLPALEARNPGGVRRLALSLENLSESLQSSSISDHVSADNGVISRKAFQSLRKPVKKQLLAGQLRQMNLKGYTSSHIEEIIKRLDTSKRVFKFSLLKLVWTVNAEQIRVSKPG